MDDNDSLTWFTVKLPSPLPEYFNLYGSTRVIAGTPVDDYKLMPRRARRSIIRLRYGGWREIDLHLVP